MINEKIFSEQDIKAQQVYENSHWNILFPRKPYSENHLMFVIKDSSIQTFDGLSEEAVLSLMSAVNKIVKEFTIKYKDSFLGYNLFSNNGSEKIGQHMLQFHQHIFLRLSTEVISPYVAMAERKYWSTIQEDGWRTQKKYLHNLFNQ